MWLTTVQLISSLEGAAQTQLAWVNSRRSDVILGNLPSRVRAPLLRICSRAVIRTPLKIAPSLFPPNCCCENAPTTETEIRLHFSPNGGIRNLFQQLSYSLIPLQCIPRVVRKKDCWLKNDSQSHLHNSSTLDIFWVGAWNNFTCLSSNSTWNEQHRATRDNLLYFRDPVIWFLNLILQEVKQMKQIQLTTLPEFSPLVLRTIMSRCSTWD